MKTETITKTVVLPLQTSNRKNERISKAIEDWQRMASEIADKFVSFPEYRWGNHQNDTHMYRWASNQFEDREISATSMQEALAKVSSSFESWKQNGKGDSSPKGDFGEGNYIRLRHDSVEIKENDKGYGLKVKLFPYQDPEWWHIGGGEYHRDILERVVSGELNLGATEIHKDNGSLKAHASVSEEIDVLEWGEVVTDIGVDIGDRVLYSAVSMHGYDVDEVIMKSGKEFRHHRDRIDEKKSKLQAGNRLKRSIQAQYWGYTDYVTHKASKEIVKFASKKERPGIKLEDLTNYRESAKDPIHDWPFHEVQRKVLYKAKEKGIPVKKINPGYTSITCRKCESSDPEYRDKDTFECGNCGYEVHADVNAAMNIAMRE